MSNQENCRPTGQAPESDSVKPEQKPETQSLLHHVFDKLAKGMRTLAEVPRQERTPKAVALLDETMWNMAINKRLEDTTERIKPRREYIFPTGTKVSISSGSQVEVDYLIDLLGAEVVEQQTPFQRIFEKSIVEYRKLKDAPANKRDRKAVELLESIVIDITDEIIGEIKDPHKLDHAKNILLPTGVESYEVNYQEVFDFCIDRLGATETNASDQTQSEIINTIPEDEEMETSFSKKIIKSPTKKDFL